MWAIPVWTRGPASTRLGTAAPNGYSFPRDRLTGEPLITGPYGQTVNWVKGLNEKRAPMRIPEKDSSIGGSLVSPPAGGVVNWQPPAYSPDTGLFYVSEHN